MKVSKDAIELPTNEGSYNGHFDFIESYRLNVCGCREFCGKMMTKSSTFLEHEDPAACWQQNRLCGDDFYEFLSHFAFFGALRWLEKRNVFVQKTMDCCSDLTLSFPRSIPH